MELSHTHTTDNCRPVTELLVRLGDKWSVIAMVMLGDGPLRFTELKRALSGISQRMLTVTLRGLERDGLVSRTAYATTPPRVDYELTGIGQEMRERVLALGQWIIDNRTAIEDARDRFDREHPPVRNVS